MPKKSQLPIKLEIKRNFLISRTIAAEIVGQRLRWFAAECVNVFGKISGGAINIVIITERMPLFLMLLLLMHNSMIQSGANYNFSLSLFLINGQNVQI